MKYFTSPDGELHCVEEGHEHLLPDGVQEIAEAEAQAMAAQLQPSASTVKKQKIIAELATIDAASARPARAIAIAVGKGEKPAEEEVLRLQELEQQAAEMRASYAATE